MNVESYVHSSSCPSSFHAVRFTEGFCGRDISRADTNPCALKDSLSTIGRRCWPLPHHHGHSSKTLARAMGTHAVGCAVELAREFLHQQVMIPAGVVAFNMVPSAIERVGNGPHYHRRGPLPRDGRDKPRCRASSLAHGGRRSHKIGRDQNLRFVGRRQAGQRACRSSCYRHDC